MGRILLWICAVVVAAGLGAATQGPGDGPSRQSAPDKGNASASQNVQIAADLGRIASALEAQNADDAAEREQRDLNAQEEMAIWAKRMFWAAVATVVVSGIGVVLIFITFQQTRRAADSADRMAEEAAKATQAALRSATVAEKALVGVERPFLVIEPGRAAPGAQYYSFVNHGRTPCVILMSDVRFLSITPVDAPEPLTANMWQAALAPGWNVVGANGGASGVESVRRGKPIVPGAERAERMMLHGYVVYRSLSGDTFVSGFGLYRKVGEPWKALTEAAFNYDERLEKGGPRKRERMKLTITAAKKGKSAD